MVVEAGNDGYYGMYTEHMPWEFDAETISVNGTVLVFRLDFALEDVIGSHACSLKALACV